MKVRGFDPLRLDVEAFAADGASLDGEWPLAELPRLAVSTGDDRPLSASRRVAWRAQGRMRQPRVGAPEIWLELGARARVPLQCQRCLQGVDVDVAFERSLRFVVGEQAAEALDADSDDDVLALTRALDLRELVEDELILALPLVAMHAVCPEPLVAPADDGADEAVAENPFAALAVLKAGRQGGAG